MRFKIHNLEFYHAITVVMKSVSFKTPFPVLSGIKITAAKEGLILAGSNSNMIIQKEIPLKRNGEKILEIYEAGSAVIPAKRLSDVVKKLPGDIHISVSENHCVRLQSADVSAMFIGWSAEDYPSLPSMNEDKEMKIPSVQLLDLITQTSFAVSKNDSKPVLTGVNISLKDQCLSFAATDSYRLAQKKIYLDTGIEASVIVPGRSLNELKKLLEHLSDDIGVSVTKSYIIFKTKTLTFFARLIDGKFPNVKGLFPKNFKTIIIHNTTEFLKAVDRACLFSVESKSENVRLDILDDKKIRISSVSSHEGNIEEIQEVNRIEGDSNFSIFFDGRFLIDALKAIKADEVKLGFGGAMAPLFMEPADQSSCCQLISPVRGI